MIHNVGNLDRTLRAIVGLCMILLAAGLVPGLGPQPWGWLGLVPLATAVMGWCPAYWLLRIDTCARKGA